MPKEAPAYDVAGFEQQKARLFKDTETLPSLACRRRLVPRPEEEAVHFSVQQRVSLLYWG